MRNNRVIGVAIAAALSLPVTMANAGSFFQNVDGSVSVNAAVDTATPEIINAGTINANFKQINNSSQASNAATPVDNTVTVVSVPSGGITYAQELFSGNPPAKLPKDKKAMVVYTIDGKITKNFDLVFTLSEGSFAENDLFVAVTASSSYPGITKTSGGSSSVTYQVKAADVSVEGGSQFLLAYQIGNTDALAQSGKEIDIEAQLKTSLTDIHVNPTRTETIATSKQSTTITLIGESKGKVNVSVAEDNKFFSGTAINDGNEGGYKSAKEARIGYISIKSDTSTKESDGETAFELGENTDAQLAEEDGLVLEITGGQFAASGLTNASKGRVYIDVGGLPNAKVTDENTATLSLSASNVKTLRENTGDADPPTQASIIIEVDEETKINSIENPPEANLQLNFHDDSSIKDDGGILAFLNLPVELRQIKKDGMVCWIFNIPHSTANDIGNIRITNDSSATETISAKMFDTNGAAIGSAESVTLNGGDPLEAGQTIRLTAGDLEAAGFPKWEGRAIMQLTTALPKIEVLNLLRQRNVSGAPLTNLSVGATGQSCESL